MYVFMGDFSTNFCHGYPLVLYKKMKRYIYIYIYIVCVCVCVKSLGFIDSETS